MASPVDTSVKRYSDNMPGAPVLNGVAGAGIALLDACLLTGFGLRTATSVVVAGGVCTVTLPSEAKNINMLHSVILVAGVTGSMTALNGEQRVTSANPTQLTFATDVADGTAAGTITIKTAPAGWEKAFSGTNVAVYRSADPMSLGAYLRVDDSQTTHMRVRMYEHMWDADTGTNEAPKVSEFSASNWIKSRSASTSPALWSFIADTRLFYFLPSIAYPSNQTYIGCAAWAFGDIKSTRPADPYGVWLGTSSDAYSSSYGNVFYVGQGAPSYAGVRLLRSYTNLGSAVQAFARPAMGLTAARSSGRDASWGAFPNTDGVLRLTKMLVIQGMQLDGSALLHRGEMPGLFYVPMEIPGGTFEGGSFTLHEGRQLMAVRPDQNIDQTPDLLGTGFIDVTGPWR